METPQEFCKRKGFTQEPPGTTSYYIMWSMMRMYARYYHEQQVKSVDLADVVGRSEQLKAVEKLKDFAYEVCPLHREDDLEEIVGSL